MNYRRRTLAAVLFLFIAQSGWSAAPYIENELLVKFRGGPGGAAAQEVRNRMGHSVRRNFEQIGWQHIRLPPGLNVEQALPRYRNLPDVLSAEPNGVEQVIHPQAVRTQTVLAGAAATNANDPLFTNQWGLTKIAAPSAWSASTGNTNVVVAVIDSGVNYNHEDLSANMWRNPGEIPGNGEDDDGNGFVDDVYGIDTADDAFGNDSDPMDLEGLDFHGSNCAGIIGAAGNNGRGIAGVNWRVQIMAIRMIRLPGMALDAAMVEAFDYALLMKRRGVNIRVVSMSWGRTNLTTAVRDALVALNDAGIVLVASAGNDGGNNDIVPRFPSCFPIPNLMAVAASDTADLLADFSNYGRTNVDLAAPGVGIVTTSGPETNRYNFGFLGTSPACPFVSGAAALLAGFNPEASASDIKAALMETVDVLPAFTNRMVSNGRLNLGRAIAHPAIDTVELPVITVQPRGDALIEGTNFSLSVSAWGAKPLAYQWRKDGFMLAGRTNSTLTLPSLVGNDSGDYTAVITNAHGAITSAVATLEVLVPPRLVAPPTPLQIAAVPGETLTLSAQTTGTLPIGYRWRHIRTNGLGRNLTNSVLNEHTCFYSFTADTNSAGSYTLVLTNRAQVQALTSQQRTNAILALLADTDSDGLPDVWEAAYATATNANDDADEDGLTNLQEYWAHTDPTNALSHLHVDSVSLTRGPDAVRLRFVAMSNNTYTIQWRATWDAAWSRLADVTAAATNRVVEVLDAVAGDGSRFYRVATPRVP